MTRQFKKKTLLYKLKQWYKDTFFRHKIMHDEFILITYFHDLKYKLKTYINPYNVIKIDSLPRSYVDPVEKMLHANFQILKDFVEKEWECDPHLLNIDEERKWVEETFTDVKTQQEHLNCLIDQNRIHQSIFDLYIWWTKTRNNRKEPEFTGKERLDNTTEDEVIERDDYGDPTLYRWNCNFTEEYKKHLDEYRKFETDCENEDQEKLLELIKLRNFLWS